MMMFISFRKLPI